MPFRHFQNETLNPHSDLQEALSPSLCLSLQPRLTFSLWHWLALLPGGPTPSLPPLPPPLSSHTEPLRFPAGTAPPRCQTKRGASSVCLQRQDFQTYSFLLCFLNLF